MADLKNMTGTEAFQLAKDESALTIEEIAERLTVSPSVIKRYLNAGDNYLPSLEMIPRLCSTLGNNILLRWLEAQVEAEENAVPPAKQDRGIDLRGPRRGRPRQRAADSRGNAGHCPSQCPQTPLRPE